MTAGEDAVRLRDGYQTTTINKKRKDSFFESCACFKVSTMPTQLADRGGTLRRKLLFLHRWLGIILGIYFLMLGVTGSLLVFAREIDRALNPELLTVQPQGQYQPLSAIVESFRREYPNAPMTYVNYPLPPNGVFNVRSGPNEASQLYVYINPYTAEIIGDRTRIGSFYGFLMYLHFYLFIGQLGWTLNGWGALLLTVALLLGVWLWWPARRAGAAVWKGRFSVRTNAGKSRVLYDLHNTVGIYPIVFSLIFTLTALVFAFPDASRRVLYTLTGALPDPVFRLNPEPDTPLLPLDELVAVADRAIDGRILRVSFPQTPDATLQVRKEWDDWNRTRNRAMVTVNPYTAEVLDVYDSRRHESPGRLLVQWAIPLHFGIWGGMPTRILYVVLGLVPVVAFVTGFWRWRLRKRAERKSQAHLRALLETASPALREQLRNRGLKPFWSQAHS